MPFPSGATPPAKSTSSSKSPSAGSRSSTRWTRRRARSSSTGSSTRRCATRGTTGSSRTRSRTTATPATSSSPTSAHIVPGAVIAVRPVGVLKMQDEAGGDEKIIAVPVSRLTQRYDRIQRYTDLPGHHAQADRALLRALQGPRTQQVGASVLGWGGAEEAKQLIIEAIERVRPQHPAVAPELARRSAAASDSLPPRPPKPERARARCRSAERRDDVRRRLNELDEHALAPERRLGAALRVDEADVEAPPHLCGCRRA